MTTATTEYLSDQQTLTDTRKFFIAAGVPFGTASESKRESILLHWLSSNDWTIGIKQHDTKVIVAIRRNLQFHQAEGHNVFLAAARATLEAMR